MSHASWEEFDAHIIHGLLARMLGGASLCRVGSLKTWSLDHISIIQYSIYSKPQLYRVMSWDRINDAFIYYRECAGHTRITYVNHVALLALLTSDWDTAGCEGILYRGQVRHFLILPIQWKMEWWMFVTYLCSQAVCAMLYGVVHQFDAVANFKRGKRFKNCRQNKVKKKWHRRHNCAIRYNTLTNCMHSMHTQKPRLIIFFNNAYVGMGFTACFEKRYALRRYGQTVSISQERVLVTRT